MSGPEFEYGVTPYYFVRHGETPQTQKGIVQGQMESELNALGRQTIEKAANVLLSTPLGSIYASPLKRTWMTAKIVSVMTGTPVHPLPGLMERHWGRYQGRPKDWRPSAANPKSVETIEDFTNRVLDAMRSISGPPPVLVVAHSGVFRILCEDAGFPLEGRMSVASGQVLEFEPPSSRSPAWHIRVAGNF